MGGAFPCAPSLWGEPGGRARHPRLRAGRTDMAAPGLGLVDPHRPGVQLPTCPTGPRASLMGACGSQPHSPGLGVPESAPAPICRQAAQGRRQARTCPQGTWGHHRAGGGRGGSEPDPTRLLPWEHGGHGAHLLHVQRLRGVSCKYLWQKCRMV